MSERLIAAMNRLAAECADEQPPARIEAALLKEFDRERRSRRKSSWALAAGAIAASITVALIFEYPSFTKRAASGAPVSSDIRESERPFVPIPYRSALAL
jgi:hypothetical protein